MFVLCFLSIEALSSHHFRHAYHYCQGIDATVRTRSAGVTLEWLYRGYSFNKGAA